MIVLNNGNIFAELGGSRVLQAFVARCAVAHKLSLYELVVANSVESTTFAKVCRVIHKPHNVISNALQSQHDP